AIGVKHWLPFRNKLQSSGITQLERIGTIAMPNDPRAGKPAAASQLVNLPRLITAYYTLKPDPAEKTQRVAFGTSGHRGSAFASAFNENHILAITQAICRYRQEQGF